MQFYVVSYIHLEVIKMNEKEIGVRIKQARELRDMTLQDIADKIGIAKSTVQRYETGAIKKAKLPVLQSIANALSVNPSWLIGKSSEMIVTCASSPFEISKTETLHIQKYRTLDEYGKKNVDAVLDNEYARCNETKTIPLHETPDPYKIHTLAAHARPDATDEEKQQDYDMMNDPSIWGDKA